MKKSGDNDLISEFHEERDKARNTFSNIEKQKKSLRKLSKKWAKETYALKCTHFLKEKVSESGQSHWVFDDLMEPDIAPFKANVSEHRKRLASTALVQYAQMKEPLKMMNDGFHSRNYKYAAAFQYAHDEGWGSEDFDKEIDEHGLSGLVQSYADSQKKEPAEDTDDDDALEDKDTVEVRDLGYFIAKPKKKLWETKKDLPEKYVDKIVVARIHSDGFEILGRFPGQE